MFKFCDVNVMKFIKYAQVMFINYSLRVILINQQNLIMMSISPLNYSL
jgi:hypothetical protein